MRLDLVLAFMFLVASCGGTSASIADAPQDASDAFAGDAKAADSGSSLGDASADQRAHGSVTIRLAATTASFAHSDGLSGQTPSDQRLAIRSLSLGASAVDASPWIVFDLDASAVLAGVNDGDDTVIATVPGSAIRSGSYAYAKVGVAYVRYVVAATVHDDGLGIPGTFHNLEVLSKGTVIGGTTYASGYSTFTFVAGGETYGPVVETSAPVPEYAGIGITLSIANGEATYGFPVALTVSPVSSAMTLTMLANTNEDFRWKDEDEPGYAPGVFDVTPPSSYEPVEQFGANSLTLSLAP